MLQNNHHITTRRVSLEDVDLEDRYFKISRNHIGDGLRSSIRDFGLLDPPVLIDRGGRYRIMFGFNRLDVLRELQILSADAIVVPGVDPEFFLNRALLKCARNESGPIGRLRALAILKELGLDGGRIQEIAVKGLRLPAECAGNNSFLETVMALPAPLREYLDRRDIQMRIIRDVVRLPDNAVPVLSRWLSFEPLRVNIFRSVVDMLADIHDRDGTVSFVENITPDGIRDRKEWEEYLHAVIFRVRYPEYDSMKKEAEEIARYFSSRGMVLDYPPYFEGDRVGLTVTVGKRDDPEAIRKKIDEADLAKLKRLLDLL
ncbi:MAG: hypothetical protein JW807_17925 [Spirochaetes bacterium]|nr:hypothetical protein [Spirochaetota bacterium]